MCFLRFFVWISLQANLYDTNVLELLSPHGDGAEACVLHTYFGILGQLFKDLNEPITAPKGANNIAVHCHETGKSRVFDTIECRWITLNKLLIESIPPTFTFAPKPTSVDMELDYFLRAAGLIKHSFVWSTDSIPVETFYNVRSDRNNFFRGRYTLTPWLPQIGTLGHMTKYGFYCIDDEDWVKAFQ